MSQIASTAHPTATFSASRDELVGPDALLGSAEIARGVCRIATRRVSLLAITPERMRRIDTWSTDTAFVTHPVAPDRAVVGTVCGREHADDLVGAIIQALVGSVPSTPSSSPVLIPSLSSLAPDRLPDRVGWVLIVTAVTEQGVERWVAAATTDGLAGASPVDHDDAVQLDAVGPIPNWTRIAALLGSRPPSIVTPGVTQPRGTPS